MEIKGKLQSKLTNINYEKVYIIRSGRRIKHNLCANVQTKISRKNSKR